ncbi:hypothetical protein SASPL_136023 [Salvia splendens]|uniref:Uncharacterized protein n=1 Tax=Salvia splendens TaxID=180675 RepID=A0A8X8WZ51_SALSN|nr:hypothetical protein SASPL_136023 [Salvia splendens]
MLEAPLLKLMAKLRLRPSCMVSTNAPPWTQRVADSFSIPRYIFETISCFTLLCSHVLSLDSTREMITVAESGSEPFLVPDIPHRIELTKAQMPQQAKKKSADDNIDTIIDQIKKARSSSASRRLSLDMLRGMQRWHERSGASAQCPCTTRDPTTRNSTEETRPPSTSANACRGSTIKEMGLGLEASGFPFIWIIRDASLTAEVVEWLEEEKGNNLEQKFYNEKFIVHVVGIGVEAGDEEGAFVKWDQVKRSIEELMEGRERRKRAKELGERTREASEGGSSYRNITLLIQDVEQQVMELGGRPLLEETLA